MKDAITQMVFKEDVLQMMLVHNAIGLHREHVRNRNDVLEDELNDEKIDKMEDAILDALDKAISEFDEVDEDEILIALYNVLGGYLNKLIERRVAILVKNGVLSRDALVKVSEAKKDEWVDYR